MTVIHIPPSCAIIWCCAIISCAEHVMRSNRITRLRIRSVHYYFTYNLSGDCPITITREFRNAYQSVCSIESSVTLVREREIETSRYGFNY